jgi:hypothetical protein
VSAIPVDSVAQVPDSTRDWPLPTSVLVVEAAAFGSAGYTRGATLDERHRIQRGRVAQRPIRRTAA